MTDILSTGISGLLASQLALNTTGHNISNVNTAGYSRQTVLFGARVPLLYGSSYVGTGVNAVGVQRIYDQYLTAQVRDATSGQSRLSAFSDLANRVDGLFGDSSTGLQPALDSFFGAVGDVANQPGSTASRQALLGQATALTGRLHTLSSQLDSMGRETEQRIADQVGQINSLSSAIANLNVQIQHAQAAGNAPNDLLDQRDELVRQLSEHVGISVVAQDGNQINVFTGSGQTLVLGGQASALRISPNAYDATRSDIVSASGAVITAQIGGGQLGGMLDFRRNLLDPARNALGRAAIALATAFNAQHHAGMDLNGQLGGDFFSVPAPAVLLNGNNTGAASVTATFGNVASLTTSDYTMQFDGSAWSLRSSDGSAVAMTGSGTAADPFVADGLNFVVAGSANAGDSFLIRPTRSAAAGMNIQITDVRNIAAAMPVSGFVTGTNIGTGSIGGMSITDASDPNLLAATTITFTSATSYQINGAGSYTFVPGSPIAVNGWAMTLNGVPQAGDTFSTTANTAGVGDNSNARALAAIASRGVLDGGNSSVGNAYAQLVAQVGTTTQQAQTGLSAQTTILNNAVQSQQNISGVNLDEEAAKLIQYQQSYQAAAQVISIAGSLFDTLINAVRSR